MTAKLPQHEITVHINRLIQIALEAQIQHIEGQQVVMQAVQH